MQELQIDLPSDIAFIGGGNMATAMLDGLDGLDAPPTCHVIDLDAKARRRHEAAGRVASPSLVEGLDEVETVVLAVKPQHLDPMKDELAEALQPGSLLISVLAGVPCSVIESVVPDDVRVVRVMPNTPMAVGEGMAAVAAGSRATKRDVQIAADICSPSAQVLVVPETKMDAITAVSGSGPAYFFRFCEVLMKAAERELDFSEAEARLLVCQTAKGAAEYLASTEGFPAGRLRKEVTSKGGTTAAALRVFDEGGIEDLARDALNAAVDRAGELAEIVAAKVGANDEAPADEANAKASQSSAQLN